MLVWVCKCLSCMISKYIYFFVRALTCLIECIGTEEIVSLLKLFLSLLSVSFQFLFFKYLINCLIKYKLIFDMFLVVISL